MRRHIVLLLVVLMLFSISAGALAGPPGDVQYSTGGVAIVAGEALAAADTPPEAVAYAANLLSGG